MECGSYAHSIRCWGLIHRSTQVEISRALVALRMRWQHTYGLVEVG